MQVGHVPNTLDVPPRKKEKKEGFIQMEERVQKCNDGMQREFKRLMGLLTDIVNSVRKKKQFIQNEPACWQYKAGIERDQQVRQGERERKKNNLFKPN